MNARAQTVADLERELLALVPASTIVSGEQNLRPFECDGLTLYRELPLLAVIPETADQVAAMVKFCKARNLPVVARGSGTGLCAGAMPHPDGILLNLARLDRILEIDTANRCARVQPGVTNLSISQAAAPHGLFYAPDPSSQIACSIGGNVAENSGGVHCLKYGLTTHNLLAVDIVTADGERLRIGSAGLDAPGPDLLGLITGSEGLLGIVVEVTVRLLPQPESVQVILAGFDRVSAAGDAVGHIIASGVIPAGLEMMDRLAIQAAEDFCHAGYPRSAEALLLCELDGSSSDVDDQVAQVSDLLSAAGATSIRVASDAAERARFWQGRKSAFPAVGRIAPDYYCMDGTIPRGRVSEVLNQIATLSDEYELQVANVFHAGDGNLHPLILFDASNPDSVRRAEAFGARILELSVAAGGCITGEHGVGLEKLAQMSVQFTEPELLCFEGIKTAFDPDLILNPGKGIPILRRCQEYRALPERHRHG